MSRRRLGTLKAAAAAVALAGIGIAASSPSSSWAQAGWYVTPSVSLTEQFDDNIFLRSSKRESDFITRATPGLKAGYESTPFTPEPTTLLLLGSGLAGLGGAAWRRHRPRKAS